MGSWTRWLACWPVAAALLGAVPARAEETPTAYFGFQLDSTGPQSTADDTGRLSRLDAQLRGLLAPRGYAAVDTQPVAAEAQRGRFWSCGGCDVPLAARLGARVSVSGWVQKVSNLILNINVTMRAVPDGGVLHAASVDIRGDTDESWSRGLSYLVRNRLFRADAAP